MTHITNLQRKVRIPRKDAERIVRAVLRGEKAGKHPLSLVFVTDRRIHALNRAFLRHDRPTDVIAFAFDDPAPGGVRGEVVVSAERAAREARDRGIPVREEVLRYVAHGVLHVLGYDDRTPAKKKKMWARQEKYLRRVLRKAR
ncbi:MAG: rRNA maturation RNase YbeY [Planctomycetota bacterium]|jgi:probable rRNA maturation factor